MLAKHRFVPFAFDLNKHGGIADSLAKKFVVAVEPRYAGHAVSTPDVLFMTSEGKLLSRVSNYASEREFLQAMKKVLKDNPEYNVPSLEEKAAKTHMEKGRLAFELSDYVLAKKELLMSDEQEAQYLLCRIARYSENWADLIQYVEKIRSNEWKDDATVEKAHMKIAKNEFKKALECLRNINARSSRYTEACYYSGVAQYHLGNLKKAKGIWKELLLRKSEHDGWVYRADWAYYETEKKNSKILMTFGRRKSLLGRIGYMGRENPDLKKK